MENVRMEFYVMPETEVEDRLTYSIKRTESTLRRNRCTYAYVGGWGEWRKQSLNAFAYDFLHFYWTPTPLLVFP